jgi:hypothetical protein
VAVYFLVYFMRGEDEDLTKRREKGQLVPKLAIRLSERRSGSID